MLKEVEWSEDRSYRTGSENEPFEFYLNGLNNCKSIDLLLGYFSSAAISVLSLGFAKFIHNGGVLRIVVNNILSEEDKKAIKLGQANELENAPIDLRDIKQLKDSLDDYGKHFFQCLSYLISQDRIQIKVVTPKGRKGIVHYKSGIFSDGTDVIGFKASCNFTAFGLLENLEELDAFLSWENSRSSKMIARQRKDFEDIFSGKSEIVNYLDIEEVKVAIKSEFGSTDIDELIIQEDELIQRKERVFENKKLSKTIKRIHSEFEQVMREPRFPYPSGPREYQIEAYSNWLANGKKGIFAMATGTGKTITSLNCLLEIYKNVGTYKALILVPTMSLVDQWKKECSKFNFTENIVSVYSLNNWQGELSRLETKKLLNKNFSFIIIATYASFLTKKFQSQLKEINEDTLLIADECHNIGSTSIMNKLKSFHLKNRIGLSATPERQYQEEVNNKIREFFGEIPENDYSFSYSMEEAIKKKPRALCPYRYYPKIVRLTDSEFNKYIEFTKRIVAMNPKSEDEKEIFNRLCIARQRIIHKATNKLEVFKSILLEEYSKRKNLNYTLVYVPEGLADEDVMFDPTKTDVFEETDADRNLLNKYTKMVGELFENVTVKQFTGRTSSEDRNKILNDFAEGNLQVITSMKCLDEGIDVPRSELAIFCSSTGNPRQFIQRRGRVLRLAEGKEEAVIYDLVVIPDPSGDSSVFKTEQGEVEKELRRVRDFAEMSENKHFTREILDQILKYYKLTL
jgi:superfamily II DNA or RNA helicase